jgi:hypothetical protein
MKDPDTTVKYHIDGLKGINTNRSNRPVLVEPSLEVIEKLFKSTSKHQGSMLESIRV